MPRKSRPTSQSQQDERQKLMTAIIQMNGPDGWTVTVEKGTPYEAQYLSLGFVEVSVPEGVPMV
jgi:hypothetical protein